MRRLMDEVILAQYNLEGKNKRKFAEIFCRLIYDVVLSKEKENEKDGQRRGRSTYKEVLPMIRSVLKVKQLCLLYMVISNV